MLDTANQHVIFLPMLVVVALTFLAFIRMAAARGKIAKSMEMDFYRAQIGGPEPEAAVVAARHYGNLFELPVLFYAACLTAFVLQAVNGWVLGLAWTYVGARLLQSAIHLTYNNPPHRGAAFGLGMLAMLALWVNLALAVFARV